MSKPYIQIDIAKLPKDFNIEKFSSMITSQGIQIVETNLKHELEVIGGPLNTKTYKLLVDKSVIDFLDLHDVEWDDNVKYYKYNRITYKYNGIK